jgi:hypothetical protein
MTNLTIGRIIGLSYNPLKFYNEVQLEETLIPEEPPDFREFMDQERILDLLESSNATDAIHGAFINYSHLEKEL